MVIKKFKIIIELHIYVNNTNINTYFLALLSVTYLILDNCITSVWGQTLICVRFYDRTIRGIKLNLKNSVLKEFTANRCDKHCVGITVVSRKWHVHWRTCNMSNFKRWEIFILAYQGGLHGNELHLSWSWSRDKIWQVEMIMKNIFLCLALSRGTWLPLDKWLVSVECSVVKDWYKQSYEGRKISVKG